MAKEIAFYFDFSSPYGYLASLVIDDLAARHGRDVTWRPILLGAIFKETGSAPLLTIPLKGDYARRDILRSARRVNTPFHLPPDFPFSSVPACRAYYALMGEDPRAAKRLAAALYEEAFAKGQDISAGESVLAIAAREGLDAQKLSQSMGSVEIKARLREEVDAAMAKGVFGSPFSIVEGEPFWGYDRLADLESWLESGGW